MKLEFALFTLLVHIVVNPPQKICKSVPNVQNVKKKQLNFDKNVGTHYSKATSLNKS